jgi:hypothetical protein
LGYQLFSWELGWQALLAIRAAGGRPDPAAEERLRLAAAFEVAVQRDREPWNYGDGDDAFVLPVFARESATLAEWRAWMGGVPGSEAGAIAYWLGPAPAVARAAAVPRGAGWEVFPETGLAIRRSGDWNLRWDLSPLGYLRTAAHGHLDALHLSIWLRGRALVVDPGTGAYFADPRLRAWLASRSAHNGPCPVGLDLPRRLGPFLWATPHDHPVLGEAGGALEGCLQLGRVEIRRQVTAEGGWPSWLVEDECSGPGGSAVPFTVRWQFAPGSRVTRAGDRSWLVIRGEAAVRVEVDSGWDAAVMVERAEAMAGQESLAGTVSPAFRAVTWAPFLFLKAAGKGGARGGKTVFSPVSPA